MATVETNNAPENTPDSANPRKRKVMLLGLVALIALGGLGVFAWYELYGRWNESTDDAYVNGNVVEITRWSPARWSASAPTMATWSTKARC